jgi:hypothetical protein
MMPLMAKPEQKRAAMGAKHPRAGRRAGFIILWQRSTATACDSPTPGATLFSPVTARRIVTATQRRAPGTSSGDM